VKTGKFDKYFITETPPNPLHPQTRNKVSDFPWRNLPISVNGELDGTLPGAFWIEPNIVMRTNEGGPETGTKPHVHDFDEYLLFMSFDPDDTENLGGEVELWMEEEKHIFTKTTLVFIPRGLYHCPLYIRKVDRPFGFIAIANTPKYFHRGFSEDLKYKDYITLDEITTVELGGKKTQITKTFTEYLQWINEKNRKIIP
jgi:hypothetical protein